MTEDRRDLLYRAALIFAWISALYGVLLIVDGEDLNDRAGWFFFVLPIALVVGERITRGGGDEEEHGGNTGDEETAVDEAALGRVEPERSAPPGQGEDAAAPDLTDLDENPSNARR